MNSDEIPGRCLENGADHNNDDDCSVLHFNRRIVKVSPEPAQASSRLVSCIVAEHLIVKRGDQSAYCTCAHFPNSDIDLNGTCSSPLRVYQIGRSVTDCATLTTQSSSFVMQFDKKNR